MKKSKSGVLIQLVAVLFASSLHFYWTWPTYALNLFYVEADAHVKKLTETKVQFVFFNQFENKEISFTRELLKNENQVINNHSIRVQYTRFLPEEIVVLGLDRVPKLWLLAVVHIAFLLAIFACVRQAVNAFSP